MLFLTSSSHFLLASPRLASRRVASPLFARVHICITCTDGSANEDWDLESQMSGKSGDSQERATKAVWQRGVHDKLKDVLYYS